MLITLLGIVWGVIWALSLFDVVRRRDIGTGSKVLWALVILLVPVVGLIVYLVARPADATDPFVEHEAGADEQLRGRHPV
jgi:Phospholipase_D-nuclease N-terminal